MRLVRRACEKAQSDCVTGTSWGIQSHADILRINDDGLSFSESAKFSA